MLLVEDFFEGAADRNGRLSRGGVVDKNIERPHTIEVRPPQPDVASASGQLETGCRHPHWMSQTHFFVLITHDPVLRRD